MGQLSLPHIHSVLIFCAHANNSTYYSIGKSQEFWNLAQNTNPHTKWLVVIFQIITNIKDDIYTKMNVKKP